MANLDIGREAYIASFACCTIRACHLELVPELSADTFLLCFRRFMAWRGVRKLFNSDNAETFKTGNSSIQKLTNSPKLQTVLTEFRITWRFNLSLSPWQGGHYERMVKEIKRCLRKTLGKAFLSFDELHTVIVEIENVLNSRPLIYYSDEDWEEPLTPSHLLHWRRILSLPDVESSSVANLKLRNSVVTRRMKHLSTLLSRYWNQWDITCMEEEGWNIWDFGWRCRYYSRGETAQIKLVFRKSRRNYSWKGWAHSWGFTSALNNRKTVARTFPFGNWY